MAIMHPNLSPSDPIVNAYAHAMGTGELTAAQRSAIQDRILRGEATDQDLSCIDRMVYCVRRGRITLA
ncbi:hypothetical protein [Prochlorothrix hollandica]|uniref:Uncharacterized protein n=1 Tax=Prochlorothrix hollandica PCC 9006 = CALU 1027 TaxID=317619 RepID=A0A0M2PXC1_PROHO|nr:hypothetical protein [Prochlorothrix hollandica]KKI99747.1 hypothetical protein PROH_07685 [Prochlorothrix hollandica PCC 9006 = CALU 1027]